ncbi:hypothetical protein [Alicyclobacillus fastidiosus]|uniref:hypothetical protein n=1 Tax=Alicyclobacillus fastidiosus TaxID=392011 RepID=UPI0023E95146|nr:hypothetical protein [Alicyclobacillus fastidiosus]GMA65966.1 hypothetical protein GCM10025859_64080 [Alicyclobacillus fastidiosus]GMA66186.1 hypothetical protein GCM10025859_66280 [Alicyclobacillus fastidiosus]
MSTKADRFRKLTEGQSSLDSSSTATKSEVISQMIGASEEISATTETGNSDTKNSSVTTQSSTTPEHTSGSVVNNTEQQQSDVPDIRNSVTEQSNVTQSRKTSSAARIPRPIEEFEKRIKKPTIEETHTRGTWLVRNDLLKRLEKLAKNQQRGFKTHLVNYALERILDEIEGK